jgi:hypothetical protein
MSKKYPECPLYNHSHCKEYRNLKLCVPIPMKSAGDSEAFRPPVPKQSGHLFRTKPATLSERSDAGILLLFTGVFFSQ